MVAFQNIVIAGGGIIGNSISYYLAKRGIRATLIDPVGISPAASGKAGGFLAKTWSDYSPYLGPLQRRSFDLHAEIAEEFGHEKVDYRRLTAAAVSITSGGATPKSKKLKGVEWADLNAIGYQNLGNEDEIAQVHPKKLCHAMWEYSSTKVNSELCIGRVVEVIMDDGKVNGVKLENGDVIEADAFIIACGPWTNEARNWFGKSNDNKIPVISGVKYHSMLVKSPNVLNQAVFFQGGGDPEFYPRPDSDVYITGFPDEAKVVTERPGDEEIRDDVIERLIHSTASVSSELGGIMPHTCQACYLPTANDGLPVIGQVFGIDGAFVATGHSCWGILNGPATGEAMAELLVDGKTTHVDIRPLTPNRFM